MLVGDLVWISTLSIYIFCICCDTVSRLDRIASHWIAVQEASMRQFCIQNTRNLFWIRATDIDTMYALSRVTTFDVSYGLPSPANQNYYRPAQFVVRCTFECCQFHGRIPIRISNIHAGTGAVTMSPTLGRKIESECFVDSYTNILERILELWFAFELRL